MWPISCRSRIVNRFYIITLLSYNSLISWHMWGRVLTLLWLAHAFIIHAYFNLLFIFWKVVHQIKKDTPHTISNKSTKRTTRRPVRVYAFISFLIKLRWKFKDTKKIVETKLNSMEIKLFFKSCDVCGVNFYFQKNIYRISLKILVMNMGV